MPIRQFLRHATQAAKHQVAVLSQPTHKVREKHVYRKKTLLQSAVVSLSSLFYLLPVFAYSKYGGTFDWDWNDLGCAAYAIVSFFSCLADGQWVGHLGFSTDLVHLCDRLMATIAGFYSIVPNLWPLRSPWRIPLTIVLFVVSFTPLHLSRSTPKTHVWEWVFYHSIWHLFSAVSISYLGPFTQDDGLPSFLEED